MQKFVHVHIFDEAIVHLLKTGDTWIYGHYVETFISVLCQLITFSTASFLSESVCLFISVESESE